MQQLQLVQSVVSVRRAHWQSVGDIPVWCQRELVLRDIRIDLCTRDARVALCVRHESTRVPTLVVPYSLHLRRRFGDVRQIALCACFQQRRMAHFPKSCETLCLTASTADWKPELAWDSFSSARCSVLPFCSRSALAFWSADADGVHSTPRCRLLYANRMAIWCHVRAPDDTENPAVYDRRRTAMSRWARHLFWECCSCDAAEHNF